MTLDMANFTPWTALAGGLLIGLAAAALILAGGRVLGVSGIVGGLLRPLRGDAAWRLALLAGMLAAPLLWQLVAPLPPARMDTLWPLLVLAGLLVGWGTRRGSGCTSGHGVCGLSRLSPRALAATLCFMASGAAAVFVLRHLLA